jgi:hypothetical protein
VGKDKHFNAGKGLEKSSPAGTAEKNRRFQPSLWDWMAIPSDLGILNVLNAHEMPGRHPAFQRLCRGAAKFDFPIRHLQVVSDPAIAKWVGNTRYAAELRARIPFPPPGVGNPAQIQPWKGAPPASP